MGASALAHVLRPLQDLFPASDYPELLVGLARPDDAAVYRRSPSEALIVTVDFFPPVVDDPADFGAIAAANAMSDVFAMGGEVLLALNLAGFPEDLPPAVVEAIIRGGAQAVRKAGGVIAGGHTVIDHEPKYGLAVVGTAHPDRLLKKGGAMPGDRLYITKPVGTGLVTTALKENAADTGHVAEATAWMRRLNMAAGRAAVAAGATAATDVSGFGLAGHAAEMAEASGLAIRLDYDALPLLPGAEAAAQAGRSPGGTDRNVEAFAGRVVDQGLSDLMRRIVYDPQTSGGLLVAIPGDRAAAFEAGLDAADEVCWHVGEAVAGVGVAFRFGPTLR